jgi:hypothetical protein
MTDRNQPPELRPVPDEPPASQRSLRILRTALLVLAIFLVAAVVVWIAGGGDDESEPASGPEAVEARIVSEDELREIAADAGQPVYWAGELEGTELELTEQGGSVLVRYLLEDDEAGTALAKRVAVGSYALPNPRKALNTFAEMPGARVENVEGVGRVVISPEAQRNVYFVDPDNEVQVEVYAPSAKRAIGLVRSGQVQPIG